MLVTRPDRAGPAAAVECAVRVRTREIGAPRSQRNTSLRQLGRRTSALTGPRTRCERQLYVKLRSDQRANNEVRSSASARTDRVAGVAREAEEGFLRQRAIPGGSDRLHERDPRPVDNRSEVRSALQPRPAAVRTP